MDLDLAERLMEAGVGLEPHESRLREGSNTFSPLLGVVADCNGKIDRPVLQLLYKINYNMTAGVDVEQAVANQDQVGCAIHSQAFARACACL